MASWNVRKREYVEKNEWVSMRKDTCETETGKKVDAYYVLELHDVSCTIAVTKEKRVILIKEYKHGVQEEILQLPCGYINTGETPFQAAQRELLEETGYASKKWVSLGKYAGSPGRLNHYYHFFYAEDCEKVQEPQLDELEKIDVHEYTIKEAKEQLKKQKSDIITPTGFFLAGF